MKIAGGEPAVTPGEKITDQQVAAARPDAIVLAWAAMGAKSDARAAYRVAEWSDVPAIRKKQVFVVRDEWLNTPGPPLTKGVDALWRIVQQITVATSVSPEAVKR